MPTIEDWRQFHYGQNKPKNAVINWKLMLCIDNRQIELIRGNYAKCKWKENSIPNKNHAAVYKIVPAI